MARNVFISFRYSDGIKYKEYLSKVFDQSTSIINCSEDKDRSMMSEDTIRQYLYGKLGSSSVTIVILTPNAITHKRNWYKIDDWIYDEIRYSLEDRYNNRCSGLIAVYTPEAKDLLISSSSSSNATIINSFANLVRENMFNIKPSYKHNPDNGIYDCNLDHYCSLISWNEFINNYSKYIDLAVQKRDNKNQYNIVKRMS